MNLRERNFPLHYWLQLHNHTIISAPSLEKRTRHPPKTKINRCLVALSPHIQKVIYGGAIDRRKGEVRSYKFPLSREQFTVLQHFGLSGQYQQVVLLGEELQLQCDFEYKGYHRGIRNIQYRLQQQQPVIPGKNPVLILRMRFQQKAPILQ